MTLSVTTEEKAHPTLVREFAYELEWRPENQYIAGTQVELCCVDNLGHRWTYSKATIDVGDVTFRWKSGESSPERVILRATLPYGVRRGQRVTFSLLVRPPMWPCDGLTLSIRTVATPSPWNADEPPPEAEREEGSCCVLATAYGPVHRVSAYARPASDVRGKVRLSIVPEDRYGNPSPFEEAVPVQVEWGGETRTEAVQSTTHLLLNAPGETCRVRAGIPMEALSLSENVENGAREGSYLVVTGNPVLPPKEGELRPAFGAIHWHTTITDGWHSLGRAFTNARDHMNLDFAVPGDHAPREERWQQTVEGVDAFYEPGGFVTLYGGEAGSDRGHTGIYSARPDWPSRTSTDFWLRDPADVAEGLSEDEGAVVIANHPAVNGVPYWDSYSWGAPTGSLRLAEVLAWGNQEGNVYPDAWRSWFQHSGASVQDALAMGHKVGFVGSSDNHPGWPGRLFHDQSKGLHPPKSVIITGAWVAALDRKSLYDALWARRTWAAWDTRAVAWFAVNGILMGGDLCVERGAKIEAHVRLWAEDALQSVEIVSEGEVVWGSSYAQPDVEVDVSLGQAERNTHFYLRALQRDGGILYASPVFVDVVEPQSS